MVEKTTKPCLSAWVGVWIAAAVLPAWYAGAGLARLASPRGGVSPLAAAGFAVAFWLAALGAEILPRGRCRGGRASRRSRGGGRASLVLGTWFALGLLAGVRSVPRWDAGCAPGKARFPEPRETAYFLIRVESIRAAQEPPAWKGRVWGFLQGGSWTALDRPLSVQGIWSSPERGSFLAEGSPVNDWSRIVAGGGEVRDGPRLSVRKIYRLGPTPSPKPGVSLAARLAEGRRRFSARLISALGEDAGTLAAWTFLGPLQNVSRSWSEPFRRTGTLHLLAISGFHMTLLAGLFWLVLKVLTGGARWCRWPALAFLGLYSYAVGAPAPALRAFLATAALALAPVWGRGARVWDALGWTAAVLPIVQPGLPAGASFPLSVGATAGVFLGGDLASRAWRRLRAGKGSSSKLREAARGLVLLLGASVGAALLTTPWCLHHFHVVYPLGVLVNLLAVPAMGTVMVCQLVSIGAIALGAGAGHPLVAAGRGAALGLLGLVRLASTWSGSLPLFGDLILGETLALTLGCGGALALSARCLRRARPPGWRVAARYLALLSLPMVLGTFVHWLRERPFREAPLEARFLDVGQGDAVLLRVEESRWLIDLGVGSSFGRDRLVPELLAANVQRLERVWITHGDADHWGGLPDLLSSPIAVDTLVLPQGAPFPDSFWRALAEAPVRPVVLRAQAPWSRSGRRGTVVRLLHPLPGPAPEQDNDNSFVLLCEAPLPDGRVFRLLTVGDLEKSREPALLAAGMVPVTVAQLGHHGSRTAGSPGWWEQTRPLLAVISVGVGNRYGFPHSETLTACGARGVPVLRTDQASTLRLAAGPGGIAIARRRGGAPPVESPESSTEKEVARRDAWTPEAAALPGHPTCVISRTCKDRTLRPAWSWGSSLRDGARICRPCSRPRPRESCVGGLRL